MIRKNKNKKTIRASPPPAGTADGKTAISIRLPDAWVERLDRIAAQRRETEPGIKVTRAGLAEAFICAGVEAFEQNLRAKEILPPSEGTNEGPA